ncbi:cell division protein FtsQ/DivIB [Halanaerobium hydrogeniformans]|uniref:Polypeptide-transport-associated domain protein FtsQ-type n=1 Tax=Halanaerobium hydrogeniformans TaxID=656519 RepID=E4RLW3_HALHG|nr:cell division protein FtsQ/DivIB [Halanaerobium hydrogeniformans]ADQ15027.1 Polypeptide-transport-associated domain protein FtsQ-type [Halanaerobium hydrogeniformans]
MEKKYQIIILAFLFIIIASLSFVYSPFFNIREFAIHSRIEIDKTSLRPYLNEFYGENIIFINKEDLEESLLEHRYISSFEIEKTYPSKIHIIIQERRPTAWLKNNDHKVVFSADGIILDEIELEKELFLPEIEGFAYLFSDQRLLFPQEKKDLLNVLNKLDEQYLKRIEKINFSDQRLTLFLDDEITVDFGSAERLEERFSLLRSILNKLEEEEREAEYINLRVINHPVIQYKEN